MDDGDLCVPGNDLKCRFCSKLRSDMCYIEKEGKICIDFCVKVFLIDVWNFALVDNVYREQPINHATAYRQQIVFT
jgi:hypothetical protein